MVKKNLHSDVLDEVFEKINECCDGQLPKGLPTDSHYSIAESGFEPWYMEEEEWE